VKSIAPKRVYKIEKREAEIGSRLKQAREHLKYSQQDFAMQVGITKKRMASYEEQRVALRYDLALRICRQFLLSEKWLATGKGDMRLCLDLASEHIARQLPLDLPFGTAFSKYLAEVYERILIGQKGQLRICLHDGENTSFIINLFNYLTQTWCHELKREEVPLFLTGLMDFGWDVMDSYRADGALPEMRKWTEPSISQKLVPTGKG
jgi:DNA-binding XRE family transcriptional regulator